MVKVMRSNPGFAILQLENSPCLPAVNVKAVDQRESKASVLQTCYKVIEFMSMKLYPTDGQLYTRIDVGKTIPRN